MITPCVILESTHPCMWRPQQLIKMQQGSKDITERYVHVAKRNHQLTVENVASVCISEKLRFIRWSPNCTAGNVAPEGPVCRCYRYGIFCSSACVLHAHSSSDSTSLVVASLFMFKQRPKNVTNSSLLAYDTHNFWNNNDSKLKIGRYMPYTLSNKAIYLLN